MLLGIAVSQNAPGKKRNETMGQPEKTMVGKPHGEIQSNLTDPAWYGPDAVAQLSPSSSNSSQLHKRKIRSTKRIIVTSDIRTQDVCVVPDSTPLV